MAEKSSSKENVQIDDAIAALVALGYKASEAEKMVKKVANPDLNSEQLIREALKASL